MTALPAGGSCPQQTLQGVQRPGHIYGGLHYRSAPQRRVADGEQRQRKSCVCQSPQVEEERGFVAGACVRKLGIEIPAVLDEFGNSTESAYTGWPDRLWYLIDAGGKVAYKSRPGPFGFHAEELKSAILRTVGGTRAIYDCDAAIYGQPGCAPSANSGQALAGQPKAAVST